jgi:drug/metabolite transporter (DMT)-like permease
MSRKKGQVQKSVVESVPSAPAAASASVRRSTELGLAVMVLVWGVNFSVVKWALEVFSPLAFNALRFGLAAVFVFVVLRSQGPLRLPDRRDVPRVVMLGLIGNVGYQMAFILGLDLTRAGHASLMLALTPMFTALLSARFGHERPTLATWLGGATSLLGVALVTGGAFWEGASARVVAGDLILVGAAMIWAVYTVGARSLVRRYGSVQTTAWTLWVGAAGVLLAGTPALAAQQWSGIAWQAWGGLAFSAIFAIGLSYLIWYRGVERIGNTATAIYSNLTPVVAVAVATAWLGEPLTATAVVGAALTIGGVLMVRSDSARDRPAADGAR